MFNVFSGAGISCTPPASLPLGQRFHHDLLAACLRAAKRYAPDLPFHHDFAALWSRRWNVLARLAACAHPSELPAVTAVLSGLRVTVPTETHLLAACHLAAGGLHVTVNVDDGIERAYALISGDLELPDEAPDALLQALPAWQDLFPRHAEPLSVVDTPNGLRKWRSNRGLVKLRGSVTEPALLIGRRPAFDTAESVRLDQARLMAINSVTAGFVVVAGYSGEDLDCGQALLARLRRGRFAWVALRTGHSLDARLRQIDSSQPRHVNAAEYLRAMLTDRGRRLPSWPQVRLTRTVYASTLTAWSRALPGSLAAQAVAWMFADAGCLDQAVELFERLLVTNGGIGAAVRLADTLRTRGGSADCQRAGELY